MQAGRESAVKLDFFDVNVFIGRPMIAIDRPVLDAAGLLTEMKKSGISRAIAWHIASHDCSPEDGNRLIREAVAESDSLYGCWAVLPPVTGEIVDDHFFDNMKRNRIAALFAFPNQERFLLNRTAFGRFFDEVSERRIPLLLSLERGMSWAMIDNLMRDYTKLTCVICDIGIFGMDRQTWPLLDTYPNVCIETSLLSLQAGGVEETVKRFGAERLLFGTGFPMRYHEAAMLQLTHAEISDSDKIRIASGNLDALVKGVML